MRGRPRAAAPPRRPACSPRALDKVIKHSSWRRHAALVAAAKSALDLSSHAAPAPGPDEPSDPAPASAVRASPAPTADAALAALLLALSTRGPWKVAEPALECAAGAPLPAPPPRRRRRRGPLRALAALPGLQALRRGALLRLARGGGDDALELAVLRVLVAFARCPGRLRQRGVPGPGCQGVLQRLPREKRQRWEPALRQS
ncbi:hypothetical protein HU200_058893 [Digitaria exilis]|uniref:Uncharacterized protein n=1 Tax=Digitaria exilis TaxID=1010633 RepID=A0A835ABY5_9POAL|nr:hypothetical protein HU200_058893 [Digitaria exilis]